MYRVDQIVEGETTPISQQRKIDRSANSCGIASLPFCCVRGPVPLNHLNHSRIIHERTGLVPMTATSPNSSVWRAAPAIPCSSRSRSTTACGWVKENGGDREQSDVYPFPPSNHVTPSSSPYLWRDLQLAELRLAEHPGLAVRLAGVVQVVDQHKPVLRPRPRLRLLVLKDTAVCV